MSEPKFSQAWRALGRLRERAAGGNAADEDCNILNNTLRAAEAGLSKMERVTMSEQGDKARRALHDMRWGPHIDDPVERQGIMDDAIKVALGTIATLEAELETVQNDLGMTLHHWINPIEYEEERVKWSKRVEMTERALYNAINEGVAHAFLDLDDDSRRARVMTQEEVTAEKAGEEA